MAERLLTAEAGIFPSAFECGEEAGTDCGQVFVSKWPIGAKSSGEVLSANGDLRTGHVPSNQLCDDSQAD
ncbi:MAG: hypothetical protein OXI97_17615 [Acidimicrobiaceae bacterium]|nr:hypothetical protein [Acidimicrobiaceae bacterium]